MDKLERGYDRVIDVWGADHHGYVHRVKAALQAMGADPNKLDVLLVQFAILYKGGERMLMSTRAGEFVTPRDFSTCCASAYSTWTSTSTSPSRRRPTFRCITSNSRTRACAACCANCRKRGWTATAHAARPACSLWVKSTRRRCWW